MRSARLLVLLVLVLGPAACANSSQKPAARHPAQAPGTAQGGTSGPQGHLTAAEYRAIVTEYRQLRPLQQSHDDKAALAHGRRACTALRSPDTRLVVRVRQDCNNAIGFFIAFRALDQAGSECTAGSERDRILCARNRYQRMAVAIRSTTNGGIALNDELHRRNITGLCADSIGMTPAQVASYRQAEQAARDAVDAIGVGDAVGFDRAANELDDALAAGSGGDPLLGIEHGCRRPAARRANPQPAPKAAPKPKPRRKPRAKPLPQMPDGSGINA